MKLTLLYVAALFLFLSSCSKSKDDTAAQPPPVTNPPTPPVTILTDPVNCPPTLYQSNGNAFQFSYARMKLIKGMSGQMTGITPNTIANYTIHVYLRGITGQYYHLPTTTIANVSYNYSLTAAFPQSTFSVKRGTGPEEIFETVILIGAKTSYLQSLSPQLNFADYGAVKMKLGF